VWWMSIPLPSLSSSSVFLIACSQSWRGPNILGLQVLQSWEGTCSMGPIEYSCLCLSQLTNRSFIQLHIFSTNVAQWHCVVEQGGCFQQNLCFFVDTILPAWRELPFNMRQRYHDRQLSIISGQLRNRNFIYCMLFKDCY